MSTYGVFSHGVNNGRADQLIMATELLKQRLVDIMCMRAKMPGVDTTPSLSDIERTHILFVNAHFRPFAAFGFEYQKVRPNSGHPMLGSSLQFSIPQFGDFFVDMVVHLRLEATQATMGVVPPFPPFIGDKDQSVSTTASVSAKEDTVNGVYTKYTYEYVDRQGNVLEVGSPARNFVRYAEYPGQRILKHVKIEVNGNPLDEYTNNAYIFHQKLHVLGEKRVGWKRLMGQEVPIEAYSDLLSVQGTSNYAAPVVDLKDVNNAAATGAPSSALESARRLSYIVNGPQTPKEVQPELNLWVPLLFWFNKDFRLAIPSVAIPYGQRYINIEVEEQDKLLFVAPGNLFLRLTTELSYSNGNNKGTAAAVQVYDVKKFVTLTPTLASGSVIDSSQRMLTSDLYVNNIFMTTEVHDIYIKRIGFTLVRVHKEHIQRVQAASENILLSSLKYPIETIYAGIRPAYNIAKANPNQYRDWHRLTLMRDNVLDLTSEAQGDVMIDDTVAFNDPLSGSNPYKHKKFSSQQVSERLVYPTEIETVKTLKLSAHEIEVYKEMQAAFYRDYITYNFGKQDITTPSDRGVLMINFCLMPGTYQPSGHINISRSREFYLHYTSDYIDSDHPGDLLVLASAINFLLVSDGSACLRYTT